MNVSNSSVYNQNTKYRPDLIPSWLFVLSSYSFRGSGSKRSSKAATTAESIIIIIIILLQ